MVRGSGSHNRQNTSNNSNNRGSRNSTQRTSAVAPEPSPPRRSSNREGPSRESVSSQRANRGSGTRISNESNRTTGISRSSTSAATTRESQRSNHGSGTRSSSSVDTSSSFSAARETNRANHGSGTKTSNESTRTSRSGTSTTTTRGSQRSNHGSRGGTTTRSSVEPTATTSSATGTHYQRATRGSGARISTSTIRTENLSANRGSGTRNNGSYAREPPRQQRMDYDVVNPEDAPLYRSCRCLCDIVTGIVLALFGVVGTILCCKLCRKRTPNDDNSDPAVNHPNRRRSGLRNRLCEIEEQMWFSPLWSVFGGMVFSILLFLILIQNSAMTNLVSMDDSYGDIRTMFAGETLNVYLPILTRSINVEVINDPPTSRGMRAAVYKSKKSSCPSLTGPRLEFQHDSELDLKGDSFVYDYYNLNPGSSVSMVMDQINDGGTYFYLLPGAKALEEIQTGENVDPNHWERIAVAMAHTVGSESTDSAFMKTPTNIYNYDNIYTLVYDNQSTHRVSSVDVQTDIVMTTHDLHGYNPVCDHMRTGDACHVYATRSDCIILEAFAGQEEDKEDEEDSQEETAADPTISLRIETFRDWKGIAIYSSIPLAISVLIIGGMYLWGCMIYCCYCRKKNETMIDENATEPLLSPDANGLEEDGSGAAAADPPPPTAPHFVEPSPVESTAPLESTVTEQQKQDNVVIIPPESVQVVTK